MSIKMRKYLVKQDNYGFQGRYWYAHTIVEFPEDVTPLVQYFELITKNTALPEGANIEKPINTFSEMQARQSKPEKTAGEIFKNQKSAAFKPLTDAEIKQLAESGNDL